MKRLFIQIILIILCLSGQAQSKYYFKQFGTKEGLSQSKVTSILNDHKGYLWIGTEYGLNRYDGNQIKSFLNKPEDSSSLPSNLIIFVAEDALKEIWVATFNKLVKFNRENDTFIPVKKPSGEDMFANSYLKLKDGLLIGGKNEIFKYDYATQKMRLLYKMPNPPESFGYYGMMRYDDNHVWIDTYYFGIYSFNLKTHQMQKVPYLTDAHYNCFFMDSQKRVWIAPYGKGIMCYKDGRLLKHFTTANSPLTYDVAYDMLEKDNRLWVATDGGGINIISLKDFSFNNIQQIQSDIHSFPVSAIFRLQQDPTGNILAGTIRGGLIGIKEVYACSASYVPFGNPHGLSNSSTNCIFQDSSGIIWIGTDGGGINQFDLYSGKFKHFPTTRNEKVVSIIEYSKQELMLSLYNKGIYLFNKASKQLRQFLLMDKETNDKECVNGYSVSMARISPTKILFSSDKIILYDIAQKKFTVIGRKGKDFYKRAPLFISTVGSKTYLTDTYGLLEYDDSRHTLHTIYKGGSTVNDACMDQKGLIWLVCDNGLYSFNPVNRKVNHIKTELFTQGNAVIADQRGRIWVGTRYKLFTYDPSVRHFYILDESDGISTNEYLFHSMLCSRDGYIFAGGTNGMNMIPPTIKFQSFHRQQVELMDVSVNGSQITLDENNARKVQSIKVPYDFSSLQLKVLLHNANLFRKDVYRFKIDGLNKQWIYTDANSLFINYLPVGSYNILVSYYSKSGGWSDPQTILHLVITPPWWSSIWALLFYIIVISVLAYFLHQRRNKKLQEHQQQEIQKIKNKTNEEKINLLINISHELRTPLTLVCAPLKRMLVHDNLNEAIKSKLSHIYSQASSMKGIIDMALDLEKIDEGKSSFQLSAYNLNDWICQTGGNFEEEYDNKGVKLTYNLDEKIGEISFDQNKCEFVLVNFLINALKFSDTGSTVTIYTKVTEDGKYARVAVSDEGIGLQANEVDHLFTRFYQGSHNRGGSGIGLSFSKEIIMKHNGHIGAFPNSDKGSTFYYELPLQSSNSSIETIPLEHHNDLGLNEAKTSDIAVDYAYLKTFSAIIVEDTPELLNYMKNTFSEYFNHVYTAKDGVDGLDIIKQRQPDIIISDVMMPLMNGFELCQKVKTDITISHIPVILLTAYHNSENMSEGYKIGADAFLPKPFDIDALLSLIKNQLLSRDRIRKRYKDRQDIAVESICFSNADEEFITKLNALIIDHIDNSNLDVNYIASNMFISRSLLYNKIKALTGMNIVNYITKVRIDQAVLLMNTTDKQLTEISDLTGFSSSRYFSRVFKALKGVTPSEYKKEINEEEQGGGEK